MYSPRISEKLVPFLYRLAKQKKIPMTQLVDDLITEAIKDVRLENTGVASDARLSEGGFKEEA